MSLFNNIHGPSSRRQGPLFPRHQYTSIHCHWASGRDLEPSVLRSSLKSSPSHMNPRPEFLMSQEIRDPGTGGAGETIKTSDGFQIFPARELSC